MERRPRLALGLLLGLALARLLAHLLTNGRFGIFRDEYYYLACAEHLSWGYVDHPPLSVAILAGWKALFGESVQAIRIPAALAASGLVFLAGVLARELGGRRAAQGLAALAVWIMPVTLATSTFHSMNCLDALIWIGALLIFIACLRTGSTRAWLCLGLLLGLGLLNKISVLLLGMGLGLGLLLTDERRQLARPGPWLAAALALLLFAPHLIWQQSMGWPTLEFMANAKSNKMVALSPIAFLAEVALEAHPFSLPLWITGLVWLFLKRERRSLAWIWPAAAVTLILQHGKPYYLAPAHALTLAAGSVAATEWFRRRRWRRATPALALFLVLGGLFTLPLCLPVLSPAATARYLRVTHLQPETGETSHRGHALPQYFADRFAWREQVAAVAAAFATLSETERADCLLLTTNYGQAGAVDYFRRLGWDLPPPVCGHNSYWYWWPEGRSAETAIAVTFRREDLLTAYESVELFTRLDVPFAMRWEGQAPIWICRGHKSSLEAARPYYRYFG